MNKKRYELDLNAIQDMGYSVLINDQKYVGKVTVGDTLQVQGSAYIILAINEDNVLVKELN